MHDRNEERTQMAKALEFAHFMATGAEQFLSAVNARDEIVQKIDDGEEVDDVALEQAQAAVSEFSAGLRQDIYEFRKRAARVGREDRQSAETQPQAANEEVKHQPPSAAPPIDIPAVPDYLPAAAKTNELVTYWLWHNGECVGSKRLPFGTGAVEVRSAVMNEAVVLCNRPAGETPSSLRSRIHHATVVVYDDRAVQERGRRELPFNLRALFPNELPFYELTFRSRLGGAQGPNHVQRLSKEIEAMVTAEGLDCTIAAGLGGAPQVHIEGGDREAIGRAEAAIKAHLAEHDADLVTDFGVGYLPVGKASVEPEYEPETEEERPRA